MQARYFAAAFVTVDADPKAVWHALTDPELIKQFMFGSDVTTDWHVGSPVTFKGEWQGAPYEDKGTIIRFDPEHCLTMTYYSPLSGKQDEPENYQGVSYMLDPHQGSTEVIIVQDNLESKDSSEQSEGNWQQVLDELKKVLERT